jgi:hypothetical protein
MIFGGQLGVSISGGIEKPEIDSAEPGILSVLSWCWDGISFFFAMIFFQVEGMPEWISMTFLVVSIMIIFVFLKWVRGTSGP